MNWNLLKRTLFALFLMAWASVAQAGEIHELILHNATTNALQLLEKNPALLEERDATNCTPLHYAAQFARINVVKWLIKHKANINAMAYDDFTPMHLTKDGEIARLLIHAGANLKLKDTWGRTPLQRAALLGHKDVVQEILDSDFPLDLTSALILGKRDEAKKTIRKHPEMVKVVEPDADLWGNTSPLGIAAGNGDTEIVELLLKAGASVNAATACPGMEPMTPLCNAVWGGHFETAELLCDAGADCNATGGKFYPHLLDFATAHSDQKIINLLIKHGGKSGR